MRGDDADREKITKLGEDWLPTACFTAEGLNGSISRALHDGGYEYGEV